MQFGKVITVIPNWNLKEDLGECIESLQKSESSAQNEIVVVDNASSNDAAKYIRANYPDVTLFSLEKNLGYAGALNVGIRYALEKNTDFVFALNNDTVIPPGCIERLTKRMVDRQDIGILAPKVLYYSRPDILFSLGAKSYRWLPVPIEYGLRKQDNQRFNTLMEFDYVTGCAMLIRAGLFEKIGLFDESYFMYYEDDDFCRRTRDADFRVACDGTVKIYHKASLSSKKHGDTIIFHRARNKIIFYRRYPHGPFPFLTWTTIFFMACWYSLKSIASGRLKWLKPYWSGLFDGMHAPLPTNRGKTP